jgi:hypothetical protein
MNLQENIRRILKEETNLPALIRRRISSDVLENEFKYSLESAFDLVKRGRDKQFSRFSYKKLLEHFIYVTISMLIDSIHYELYSTLPEDIQWYDDVYKILEKHYRKRIVDKFMNHFSI